MIGLTPALRDCFNVIRAHVKEHGVAPSYEKLADLLRIPSRSKGRAYQLVSGLVERRYLVRDAGEIKLARSEYDHRAEAENCLCPRCPARRRQYQQLIQGLQRDPKFKPSIKLTGIRCLAPAHRAELLGKRNHAAPRTRKSALPSGGC